MPSHTEAEKAKNRARVAKPKRTKSQSSRTAPKARFPRRVSKRKR